MASSPPLEILVVTICKIWVIDMVRTEIVVLKLWRNHHPYLDLEPILGALTLLDYHPSLVSILLLVPLLRLGSLPYLQTQNLHKLPTFPQTHLLWGLAICLPMLFQILHQILLQTLWGGTTITPVFPFPGGNHAQSNPVIPMNIFVNVPPPWRFNIL